MAKKKLSCKKSASRSNPKVQGSRKKKGSGGSAILTVIIVALLTAVIGIYLLTKYGEKIPPYLIPKKISKPEARVVSLFFSNEDGIALKAEKREIEKGALAKEIKEAINDLVGGPKGKLTDTIPAGTKLLTVEVKEGIVYLNFNKEISQNHPGGSSAELQTIYSLINTATLNFPEVKKVQLLIEGKKLKTLAGHIDISFPLGPNKDLIKG
ncbi:MAG: GerMN domain-containing protein [Deltaproteobacteria bacterium]|nr:GerMN domain-containing protein [Deltaproteobacteria bacterium]